MDIDLNLLHNNSVESIKIHDFFDIPSDYYLNTEIISLSKVEIDGEITRYDDERDKIICKIIGSMEIPDSISLEKVCYPFCIEYDDIISESCKKNENILDIFQFLWENIVLEVPLQFTKVDDLSKFHGDGWKLISEDELNKTNNPFSDLLKDYEKE